MVIWDIHVQFQGFVHRVVLKHLGESQAQEGPCVFFFFGMIDKNQKFDVVHWPVPTPTCVCLFFFNGFFCSWHEGR